jgi:hemerythrin-like domain-containing protein
MQTLEDFRTHHREIRAMIVRLERLLTAEQLQVRPNAMVAHQLICHLAERVKQHLAEEDRGLYPALLVHEDPRIKSIAWGFISGERPLRRLFEAYRQRWLADCELRFEPAFLSETRDMLGLIQDRIQREEQTLFPRLEQAIGRTPPPPPRAGAAASGA